MLCHISRQKLGGLRKYVLRIASVGEAKALLSRTTGSLTLAHTPPQVYYISLLLGLYIYVGISSSSV